MEETKCDHAVGLFLNSLLFLFTLGVVLVTYIKVCRIEHKLCHPPVPPDGEAVKIDLTLDEK